MQVIHQNLVLFFLLLVSPPGINQVQHHHVLLHNRVSKQEVTLDAKFANCREKWMPFANAGHFFQQIADFSQSLRKPVSGSIAKVG